MFVFPDVSFTLLGATISSIFPLCLLNISFSKLLSISKFDNVKVYLIPFPDPSVISELVNYFVMVSVTS